MKSLFAGVEPQELRERLQRFAHIDPAVSIPCAALSPRVAQLATSFPLLFSMLATSCGPDQARAEALRLVEDGRALREIAAALSVPMSLRRLPLTLPPSCPRS